MPSQQEQISYLLQFYTAAQILSHGQGCQQKISQLYEYSQPQQVDIQHLQSVNSGQRFVVNSPDGWVAVDQWRNKGIKSVYTLNLPQCGSITASDDHLFQKSDNSWCFTKDLKVGDELLTVNGFEHIESLTPSGQQTVYDLAIDHENHRYYTNGICSHNSGKSLFLQNLALNWAYMGMDVIYFSLELSENLVAARLDSMVTGYSTKEIFRKIDDVDLKVRMTQKSKKAGDLRIKKMSEAGTSANDLRAYIKEYEMQTGKKPTAILVDYLDLMYPNNKKINPSDMFIKDKFVAEELRALAGEFHILLASASQLNRGSVEANGEFDHSHIAGGLSKINTADNVFAIYTTPGMKERGEYQLQMLKTRSSASVGQRVELGFDSNSLLITDADPDRDQTTKRSSESIAMDIKNSTNVSQNAVGALLGSGNSLQVPSSGASRTNMMSILNKVRNK